MEIKSRKNRAENAAIFQRLIINFFKLPENTMKEPFVLLNTWEIKKAGFWSAEEETDRPIKENEGLAEWPIGREVVLRPNAELVWRQDLRKVVLSSQTSQVRSKPVERFKGSRCE